MTDRLTCRHTSRVLSDRLERSLSCLEWLCLGVHLLGCQPCSRFGRAIRRLHRIRLFASATERLPAAARERILLALEQAAKEE